MRTITLSLLLVTLVFTGCGDPQVEGNIKYSDGTPLKGGMVILQNEKSQGLGEIRQDGSFSVYQYKPGDGLKRGKYRGYISGAVTMDDQGRMTLMVPEKYTDMSTSGIEYDSAVHKGKLDIVIDRQE